MNKKKWKIRLLLLPMIAGTVLAACTQSGDDALPPDIMAPLGVGNVYIVGETATTRANRVITSGKLLVGIGPSTNGIYLPQPVAGLVYEYKNGAWTCPASVILRTQPISLYAYYPQDQYTMDTSAHDISFGADKYSTETDLCYAIGTREEVTAASPEATFELKHAHARVRLSVTRIASFTGVGKITAYNLKAATGNIYLAGSVNFYTGALTSSSESSYGYTYGLNTTVVAGTANTDCDMLLPPQTTPTDGIAITLTIDGNPRSVTIPKDKFGDSLKENNQYTVHLEIQSNSTLVVGADAVTEGSWAEPGSDFGGTEDLVIPTT